MVEPIGKAYKPYLIASLIVLVGSLVLLAGAVVGAFLSFGDKATPLWIIVVGVFAFLGVGLGFGGLFLLMGTAAWQNFQEGRRVKLLPPE